jgi:hypothetical protein
LLDGRAVFEFRPGTPCSYSTFIFYFYATSSDFHLHIFPYYSAFLSFILLTLSLYITIFTNFILFFSSCPSPSLPPLLPTSFLFSSLVSILSPNLFLLLLPVLLSRPSNLSHVQSWAPTRKFLKREWHLTVTINQQHPTSRNYSYNH